MLRRQNYEDSTRGRREKENDRHVVVGFRIVPAVMVICRHRGPFHSRDHLRVSCFFLKLNSNGPLQVVVIVSFEFDFSSNSTLVFVTVFFRHRGYSMPNGQYLSGTVEGG